MVGMDHCVLIGVATGNEAPIVDINRQLNIRSDIDAGEEEEERERGKEDEGRRSTRIRIALPCLVRHSIQER